MESGIGDRGGKWDNFTGEDKARAAAADPRRKAAGQPVLRSFPVGADGGDDSVTEYSQMGRLATAIIPFQPAAPAPSNVRRRQPVPASQRPRPRLAPPASCGTAVLSFGLYLSFQILCTRSQPRSRSGRSPKQPPKCRRSLRTNRPTPVANS